MQFVSLSEKIMKIFTEVVISWNASDYLFSQNNLHNWKYLNRLAWWISYLIIAMFYKLINPRFNNKINSSNYSLDLNLQ